MEPLTICQITIASIMLIAALATFAWAMVKLFDAEEELRDAELRSAVKTAFERRYP